MLNLGSSAAAMMFHKQRCSNGKHHCWLYEWNVLLHLQKTPVVKLICYITEHHLFYFSKNCSAVVWRLFSTCIKHVLTKTTKFARSRWFVTLAWWRSTPYMDSFLAFSRKCISASPGVIPLTQQIKTTATNTHVSMMPRVLTNVAVCLLARKASSFNVSFII